MKLILLSFIFISFTGVALINLNNYRKKVAVFEDVIKFLNLYKNEINFNKATFSEVMDQNLSLFSLDCREILLNIKEKNKYPSILNNIEIGVIYNIFNGLGRHDLESETRLVESSIVKLEEWLEEKKKEKISKGELRSKLIFIFGIMLIILFL